MMQTLVIGMSVGAVYGLLALGIVVVYKTTRVLNFALAELGTFAAYVVWQLTDKGMSWWLAAPIAILVVSAIGLVFERLVIWPNIQATRLTLTIATLGLGLVLLGAEAVIWGVDPELLRFPVTGCPPGIELASVCVTPARVGALLLNVVLGFTLLAALRYTTFGLGVLAAAEDPITVRLMGVRLSRISMFAWGLSAALAAMSGLVLIPSVELFYPGVFTQQFLRGLAAALVGGFTSLPGAFVGGIAIGIFEESFRTWFPNDSTVVEAGLFVLVLAIILLRPRGLLGKET